MAMKTAAKRINSENSQLHRDVGDWEELFKHLQVRPEQEAWELFRRLRSSKDPLEVLNFIRQGDLLLSCGLSTPRTEAESKINAMALERAPIKVPAKPWTTVAQDGIVSELISAWFKWDDSFGYPFLDQELFLDEMRSGNVDRSRYCSRFLVNALCAFRCVSYSCHLQFSPIVRQLIELQFTSESMRQTSLALKIRSASQILRGGQKAF